MVDVFWLRVNDGVVLWKNNIIMGCVWIYIESIVVLNLILVFKNNSKLVFK